MSSPRSLSDSAERHQEIARNEGEPRVHSDYLDRLMRRESFQALWPLFAKATQPAKEMTESFSALVHLRPFIERVGDCRVIHVGDGAHARTAALFALKTKAENISVDPLINEKIVQNWRQEFKISRFTYLKSSVQQVVGVLNQRKRLPTFVTFVHAHVAVDSVLSELHWDAAYTLSCCSPARQLTKVHHIHAQGEDFGVLSVMREYQVLVNRESQLFETSD